MTTSGFHFIFSFQEEEKRSAWFPEGCITVYIPLELPHFFDMEGMGTSPSEAETSPEAIMKGS